MNKKIVIVLSLILILFISGCGSIETIDKLEFNLTDTYFSNELICYESQCSQKLLKTEKVVACYKGCKITKINETDNCFKTCELIYE